MNGPGPSPGKAWHLQLVLLAALAGLGAVHLLPRLPGRVEVAVAAVVLGACLVGFLAVAWGSRRHGRAARIAWWCWLPVAALLGFGLSATRAHWRMAEWLPVALEGQVLTLQGRVDSLPQRLEGLPMRDLRNPRDLGGWRFEFVPEPEATPVSSAALPPRLLLSCYGMPQPPQAGEQWRLDVKLRRPHGLMNPGGWDGALWMLSQDLPAAGSCRSKGQQRLAPPSGWSMDGLRQRLRESIARALPAPDQARSGGVLAALSLGDQSAVERADWALYRDTGVAHLLSVSGLHITLLGWMAGWAAGRLWRLSARLCLLWPAPRAAMWVGVAVAGVYARFSGWGVPAQRTLWLLLALALLRQLGLRWPWSLSLLAAGTVVALLDPWALAQAGFWLSFCAVGLLMASEGRDPGLLKAWRGQWVLTLGLAPLGLLLFQQFSLAGLVANAVAIPLVSYLITPLALLGALWPPLWELGAWLVQGLNTGLQALQHWPLAVWHLPWAPAWAQLLGLAGGVLAAMPWPWRLRLCGAVLCLPLLWPPLPRPPNGELELWLPDVGQGGAVLLRTRQHAMLFDAGPAWSPSADAGQRVLLPLLRGLGQRRLDLLMVSHADQDHAGGQRSLLRALPVARRLGAVPDGQPCERGQHWRWDGVLFEVLHPLPEAIKAVDRPGNAQSCVLRISTARQRVLLTGDIEHAQEAELLAREAAHGLKADVMQVPHHGSLGASSEAFVSAVAPRVALVQAGYLNRFGHPRAEVVARYRTHGATVLDTAHCGAWHWRSDESSRPAVEGCERWGRRRYWLQMPEATQSP